MKLFRDWFQSPIIGKSGLQQTQRNALPAAELAKLREALLASPYLQKNVLNVRFATTLGFSVIFQQPEQLLKDFGFLQSFLRFLDPRCTLYYLNVLALEANSHVERHIDHSIRGYNPQLPFPQRVTVLYVDIPPMQGGELQLYDRYDQVVERVVPESNLLLHFKGDCKHAVSAVSGCERPRLSLVCEQYRLSPSQLQDLPAYTIKSTAGFGTFLQGQLEGS